NSVLFKELPRSPIAAILLANLINENSKDLPANMTELFNKYIELMLGRWDIQKGLQSQKEYEASENILMDLSVYMIENSLPVLSNVEFQDRISGYLNQRNMEIEPSMLYDKIVNRSGLLVNDVDKHVIYFKHRTFMEFLYAKKCSKGKILDIDTRAFNYYWQNIYYFYVGLNKDCPAILQQIIDVVPVNEPQKWFRLSNVGNYLMAGYSSPYQIVQDNLYKIFIEASILYQDIVASKIKSPFSNVSQIYLFWFITIVLKNSYAYEYFQKSLEDTNILIDDNTQKDAQVKSFALFFAAVIAHELEMEKPFDFMISNYKDEIPLPVGFGILYETKDYDKSEAIKKYLKKMKRNVKMSKSLNDSMMVLHQRPIKQLKIT
ncbi:MAG: hypothetical protein KJ844_03420, partial [Candidatus Edwardsbacteria bacterium]|nr:hypothetical protein [Candidatus Edwardsbacteria bacterium]